MNKIENANCGIIIQSNSVGCDRDLCDGLEDDRIASDDGASFIISMVYKRDQRSVVSSVFTEFGKLMQPKGGSSESFPDYDL